MPMLCEGNNGKKNTSAIGMGHRSCPVGAKTFMAKTMEVTLFFIRINFIGIMRLKIGEI